MDNLCKQMDTACLETDDACLKSDDVCLKMENMNIEHVISEKRLKTEAKVINSKWYNILYKALYMSNNDKIVYPISKFKSLMLWPWEMTPYQKFKLANQDYRDSCIFVKNEDLNFREDYATIV